MSGSSPDPTDWLFALEHIGGVTSNPEAAFGLFPVRITEVARGRAVVEADLTPRLGGGVAGGAHGGVVACLADIALVTAAMSATPRSAVPRGTAELSISYLRPAAGAFLRATATVLKMGGTLAVADIEIHNDRGVLVAKARGAYAMGRAASPPEPDGS